MEVISTADGRLGAGGGNLVEGAAERSGIDFWRGFGFSFSMTAAQLLEELNTLPRKERAHVMEETLRQLTPEERKPIERLIRRLQHPDVPESFWQGVEDHEDDRTVEMDVDICGGR